MATDEGIGVRDGSMTEVCLTGKSSMAPLEVKPNEDARLLRNRNFIRICIGSAIAMLGSQFTALALPWLVLKMTGDPVALATVMVISGAPQIVLLLFGGGLVDKYSPKRILTWSYVSCAILLLGLSGLLFMGRLELWMIDVFAFSTGLVFGISVPASFSSIAAALPKSMVPAASSVIGSIRQAAAFVGPLLAGVLLGISVGESTATGVAHTAPDMSTFAIAFLIDGLGLALVALIMLQVAFRPVSSDTAKTGSRLNIIPAVKWFLADRQALTVLCYWMLVSFVLSGPVRIALPLLAEQSTELGAQAYGLLVSANSAGVFLGMTALGLLRAVISKQMWSLVLLLDAIASCLLVAIGAVHPELNFALFLYIGLLVLVGTRTGFVEIAWFSWLQQRYPDEIRGRATSVFMVVSTINISASVALSGWMSRQMPAKEIFLLAGAATLLVVTVSALLKIFGVLKIDG
ncbi:MFS transporter [Xanthomonas sp. A2111]|uniref:MFS transporter n=1 Tax=Xanthomonas hawaiiensis TaxID=3003247 RepID=A0ABU2IAI8_9XANT|nr:MULTISPECIES: MFS transporter [unclassified Xanthomonas]MBO9830653.1 MFS transporter [Xanthomonas sp. A2111]MBO9875826.1 MFS transporter [Xanthomonas sp. D-93]MDS9995164.1 MFS transporter [Xanthomonas sp. A2111]WNH46805.1 MFS transporter [Xanthomonas sp. A6251]